MSALIARLPPRAFSASFFAVVALGMAALFTPFFAPFLHEPLRPRLPAIVLPFLAAACAYGWAWLLHPRAEAQTYGPVRGAAVALLSYLSFMAVLLALGLSGAWFLLQGFAWTPFPYYALGAGAVAGEANLRKTRARAGELVSIARLAGVTGIAIFLTTCVRLRNAYTRLETLAAEPRAGSFVTTVVSSCLVFAGGALGLAGLHPQIALADAGIDLSLRLLPGMVALILALTGWAIGRVLLARAPAAYRLRMTLVAVTLAVTAAVWFSTNVAA